MYTINDKATGRFLSLRSVTEDKTGEPLLITYTGKLGTEFYKSQNATDNDLNLLQARMHEYGVDRLLHTIEVNTDTLPVGERIIEKLTVLAFAK